ncbi:MAG: hypothetical protein RL033_2345 [Pseudomonadota bacterium]|jgi:hypothetical protein
MRSADSFDEDERVVYLMSMLRRASLCWLVLTLSACSGAGDDGGTGAQSEIVPLLAQEPSAELVTFVDPDTGFSTQNVHDVDRQIIHFDTGRAAMIWGADGAPVSGWVTNGNELRWNRGGAFLVRFGTEAGERRAYFTEPGPGTICNLDIRAPEQLFISASRETPPQP